MKTKPCPWGKGRYCIGENGCWNWLGAKNSNGYGHLVMSGHHKLAHRVSYEYSSKEKIPKGMTIDHKCRNRACINPTHLRVMTMIENVMCGNGLPAINKRKTHCVHGHILSGDNLRKRLRDGKERRICKECARIHRRTYRRKKRRNATRPNPVDAVEFDREKLIEIIKDSSLAFHSASGDYEDLADHIISNKNDIIQAKSEVLK